MSFDIFEWDKIPFEGVWVVGGHFPRLEIQIVPPVLSAKKKPNDDPSAKQDDCTAAQDIEENGIRRHCATKGTGSKIATVGGQAGWMPEKCKGEFTAKGKAIYKEIERTLGQGSAWLVDSDALRFSRLPVGGVSRYERCTGFQSNRRDEQPTAASGLIPSEGLRQLGPRVGRGISRRHPIFSKRNALLFQPSLGHCLESNCCSQAFSTYKAPNHPRLELRRATGAGPEPLGVACSRPRLFHASQSRLRAIAQCDPRRPSARSVRDGSLFGTDALFHPFQWAARCLAHRLSPNFHSLANRIL